MAKTTLSSGLKSSKFNLMFIFAVMLIGCAGAVIIVLSSNTISLPIKWGFGLFYLLVVVPIIVFVERLLYTSGRYFVILNHDTGLVKTRDFVGNAGGSKTTIRLTDFDAFQRGRENGGKIARFWLLHRNRKTDDNGGGDTTYRHGRILSLVSDNVWLTPNDQTILTRDFPTMAKKCGLKDLGNAKPVTGLSPRCPVDH